RAVGRATVANARGVRAVDGNARTGAGSGRSPTRSAAPATSGQRMSAQALATADRGVEAARSVRGSVRVPGDKSISHRATLFNALGQGEARISNFSPG